jgi:pimeloyl-ACP methyl ester carboxylesterase
MKLTEREIELNGKKYQYLDTDLGEEAIVFVHGLGSNKDIMPKIFNSFLKDYRCIFLDLPGHNKLPNYNFEKLEDFADYIINFVEGTHLTKFSLVGFSYGGLISVVTQKKLKEKGINVKAVAWASPMRKDFLTLKSKIFLKIVDKFENKKFRKLPGNIYFRFVVALLGIKVTDDELNSFKYFDNNLLDKFHKLMPDHFINTDGQEILYIYGSKDPLINEQAMKKTILHGENQFKFKITKGGHYMTKIGKRLAHEKIREFLKSN